MNKRKDIPKVFWDILFICGFARFFLFCIGWQKGKERGRMRISLCMIVRQEEKALERCLEGIADAVEEIVIVDTGSTDRTKEIARQFTDKIYDFPWGDDFAAARNFAFSKGTGEYLLWMDAEDILPSGEKEKLLALKADLRENPCDMVMMLFDRGVDEGGRTKFSCYRERLVRRCPQARWQGRANEVIPPFGSVRYEEIHFVRRKEKQKYSDCNLRIYEKMLAEGEKLSAREWFYYGRELFAHEKQEQAAEVLRKFLENPEGGAENKSEAVRMLANCLRAAGKEEEGISLLLTGLQFAPPTGEHCCEIGEYFYEKGRWEQAIFWYENALHAERRTEQGTFVQEECYGFLPCIRLCVCYGRLGEWEMARMYNEMAGVFRPEDASVRQNREYFAKRA